VIPCIFFFLFIETLCVYVVGRRSEGRVFGSGVINFAVEFVIITSFVG
jgi:hypothetical protein